MSDDPQTVDLPVSVLVRWHQWLLETEADLIKGNGASALDRLRKQREEYEDFNEVLEAYE